MQVLSLLTLLYTSASTDTCGATVELGRKDELLTKAQEAARRTKAELEIAEHDQRQAKPRIWPQFTCFASSKVQILTLEAEIQAVHEAVSLKQQLAAARSDEKDAVESMRSDQTRVIRELESRKNELELLVQQLQASAKLLAREKAELEEALARANRDRMRALQEVEELTVVLAEEKGKRCAAQSQVAGFLVL